VLVAWRRIQVYRSNIGCMEEDKGIYRSSIGSMEEDTGIQEQCWLHGGGYRYTEEKSPA